MLVTYRDEFGIVEVVVDDNISFVNEHAFFGSGEKDYKIAIENIVCVSKIHYVFR